MIKSTGKLTARKRISKLLDQDTFYEIGSHILNSNYKDEEFAGDGVITGYGEIYGKKVFVYAQDISVKAGTLGLKHGKKIAHIIDMAIKYRCPIIGINDSGGARIQEGVNALAGYGEVFNKNIQASGYIPQICIIAGTCAGGAVYSPALMDFVFVIDDVSQMYITGPEVIKQVTGQNCDPIELGGAKTHSCESGVAHFRCANEEECYQKVRRLIDFLPKSATDYIHCKTKKYRQKKQSVVETLVPLNSRKIYNIKNVINCIFDDNSIIEVQEEFAPNIITLFAKIAGIHVAVIANQPYHLAGTIDCNASIKAAQFIQFCDGFNIPIISFVDVPGFLPGLNQEKQGIIRHGSKMLFAYANATTIKITILLRKAYGGAYIAMCSKHLGADSVYSWPHAEVAVLGAEGAVSIIHRKELSKLPDNERDEKKQMYVNEYKEKYMNSMLAMQEGYIDEEIRPIETRNVLINDLNSFADKKNYEILHKKHGNIAL